LGDFQYTQVLHAKNHVCRSVIAARCSIISMICP
jgi:hypothetical protein